jgi:hypothetical protein
MSFFREGGVAAIGIKATFISNKPASLTLCDDKGFVLVLRNLSSQPCPIRAAPLAWT